jgi:hypothetical protein
MSLDVKFSATDAGFTSTVSKVKTSVKSMDEEVAKTSNGVKSSFGDMVKAGAALAAGFGAIKAAAKAIAGTFDQFGKALAMGGELDDLNTRTGETVANLAVLQNAFEFTGVGADKVGGTINKLQKFMDDAAQGSEKNNEVLGRLGLTMADMAGKTPTQQMELLADRLQAVGDDGEASALAMSIFGKAGGQLLPILKNFSSELGDARDRLGSMPLVMQESAQAFARIEDNIATAKNKFMEFAAGLLNELAPAIELATKLISNFDAAGAGMKLGEIITGASNAMGGFTDALSAIKLGEFGLAFKITFESIKLQAADSINSIAANVMAAVQASGAFLLAAFGPGSGIYTIVSAQFDVLSAKFQIAMIEGVKAIATALTTMFDTPLMNAARKINPILDSQLSAIEGISKGFEGALGSLDKGVTDSQNKISNAVGQIAGDFKLAGQEASKAYDAALSSSNQLIDTSAMEVKLQEHRNELKKLEVQELAAAAKSAAEKLTIEEQSVKTAQNRLSHEERIKELDADIASAKRQGNKEELAALESMKAYHLELQASKEKGLSLDEAMTNANKARQAVIDGIVNLTKKEANQTNEIRKNMVQIKTVGDLIAKTKAAEPMKTFTERSKEARKQVKELAEFLGGDFSRMNIFDLSKKLGIGTTKKEAKELLTEIEKKLKEISAEKVDIQFDENSTKEQLIEIQKKVAAMKTGNVVTLDASGSISEIRSEMKKEIDLSLNSSTGSTLLQTISGAVEKIHQLVESLEKKLPVPALGA